jgi:ATP-binding cassette subfamily B protein
VAGLDLVPLPFIAWMIHLVRDRLRTGFEKIDRVWGEVTNVLADTIPGIRVVKAFAQEKREATASARQQAQPGGQRQAQQDLVAVLAHRVLPDRDGPAGGLGFGIWQVSRARSRWCADRVHRLHRAASTAARFDEPHRLGDAEIGVGAKRIFDILDHVSRAGAGQPVKLEKVEGNITCAKSASATATAPSTAASPGHQAGEMIGLVGHSGSGKSTLVNLICRFYDVAEGAILLDGVDIRSFAVRLPPQHRPGAAGALPVLRHHRREHRLRQAGRDARGDHRRRRAAHAHEFILRLPQGYDSLVGERGQGLSGGERQRISIARALLIDPRILILDEATASVDSETEKEIQKALDNLVQGRTTIAIAHRLSTLRKADRLVVLDRGVVVEEGPHDELMALEGAYYRLYQAQARNAELARRIR